MKRCLLASSCLALAALPLGAAPLESARVTAAINKVLLAEPAAAPRPASLGDILRGRASLETGDKSRAELTFNDSTIARLGANSVFSFSRGTRGMEVNSGVMLLQVPKNAGGATIQAGAVTAAVTGTTVAIEHFPGTSSAKPVFKLLCLEGRVRAFLRGLPGESVLLDPGQMIIYNMQGRLPNPVVFDLARLVRTSGLLSKEFGELPSKDLIAQAIADQRNQMAGGRLLLSNFTLNQQLPPSIQIAQSAISGQSARVIAIQKPPASTPAPKPPQTPPPPPPTPAPTPQQNPYYGP